MLEAVRGSDHVTVADGTKLVGETTVTGAAWDLRAWVEARESVVAWNGTDEWPGSSWSGSSWSGGSCA